MADRAPKPETLGDTLKLKDPKKPFNFNLTISISMGIWLLIWGFVGIPLLGIMVAAFYFVAMAGRHVKTNKKANFLLRYDQQSFMAGLKLSQKTVLFDGDNIYHFGHDNKVGVLALGALVSALRSEGYRIVCFFDAAIYFKLRDKDKLIKQRERFSVRMLEEVFDLQNNEIYVVPKGNQADKFIIESLKHLPISFVVTNDRFRDYEESYGFLAEDNQWRKGVKIQGGNLLLYQHKFKHPLKMK